MSQAKRRSVRKRAAQAIVVSNSMNGESMGRIGNLSLDGLMLIASKPVIEEHYFQFSFPLTLRNGAAHKLEIGVQCLWAEQSRSANAHFAGFKIIDIADADIPPLKIWVDEQEQEAPLR
jgi:hypothetical protein